MGYEAPLIAKIGHVSTDTKGCDCSGTDSSGGKQPPPMFD
jgi:hypothetical protein